MAKGRKISRRSALGVAAGAAALPLVHIRTAGAAGKLAVGFLDHWVPRGNELMRSQVGQWAERNKVDVVLPDKDAERDGDLRVVDESGEDYLFSTDRFVAIDVPAAVKASLLKAS